MSSVALVAALALSALEAAAPGLGAVPATAADSPAARAGSPIQLTSTRPTLTRTVTRTAPGESTGIVLRLPAGVAAVEGRVLLPPGTADVQGVVQLGSRRARVLAPRAIEGGVRFALYRIDARRAATLAIVLTPRTAGAIGVRVVIDAAGDARGRRLRLAGDTLTTTLRVVEPRRSAGRPAAGGAAGRAAAGGSAPSFAAPRDPGSAGRPARRALLTPRDVLADGRIGRSDVAAVRAAWSIGREAGRCREGTSRRADANDDGCLDALDLQALVGASGTRVAPRTDRGPRARPGTAGGRGSRATTAGPTRTFMVTSTADTPDVTPGDGLCADGKGRCTLRAAIAEADMLPGDDRIAFALPGEAPVTIQVQSPLPVITSGAGTLVIDGYSQPGSRVNTAAHRSNAIPGVELRGTAKQPTGYGLFVTSGGNTIRGLVLNGFRYGVFLDGTGAVGNRVTGNWIGLSRTGGPVTWGDAGVVVNIGAKDTVIGGTTRAERNVVGEWRRAITLYGEGVTGTVILGNLLCMTATGQAPARCNVGIDLNFGPSSSLIGGTTPGARNVVGPAKNQAVELSHAWDPALGMGQDPDGRFRIADNRVIGNWLGFKGDGSHDVAFLPGYGGNDKDNGNAVNLFDGPTDNLVEGNVLAAVYEGVQLSGPATRGNRVVANVIGLTRSGAKAPLRGWGIRVDQGASDNALIRNRVAHAAAGGVGLIHGAVARTRISRTIVSATAGPAIDLFGRAGPDPNDAGDLDTGANGLLNTPVVAAATTRRVRGTGQPGSMVEVFRATRGAGRYGLPSKLVATAVVSSDGGWSATVTGLKNGQRVTALQVRPDGTTSELSRNRVVKQAP